MKRFLFFMITIAIFFSLNAQEKLKADPEKTKLTWLGEKVTGEHNGTINLKSGWLSWQDNRITSGEFVIDMTTIEDADDNKKLEGHLRSDDFFGVEKYPVAVLKITGSTPFEKGTGLVKGLLTIKDKTHPVEFRAAVQKKDEGTWFFSNINIDRTKYDVRYGSGTFFENLGDKTIYDEFRLKVNLMML